MIMFSDLTERLNNINFSGTKIKTIDVYNIVVNKYTTDDIKLKEPKLEWLYPDGILKLYRDDNNFTKPSFVIKRNGDTNEIEIKDIEDKTVWHEKV